MSMNCWDAFFLFNIIYITIEDSLNILENNSINKVYYINAFIIATQITIIPNYFRLSFSLMKKAIIIIVYYEYKQYLELEQNLAAYIQQYVSMI